MIRRRSAQYDSRKDRDSTADSGVISEKQKLLLTFFLYIMNLAIGFSLTMIGSLMPHIIKHYDLKLYQGGFLVVSQTIGGMVALLTGAFFIDRISKVELNLFLLLLFSIMLGFCSLPIDYHTMILVFFMIGISPTALVATSSALMSDVYQEDVGPHLLMMHAFFAIGVFLAPLYAQIFLHTDGAWRVVFLLCAATCLMVLTFYYSIRAKRQTNVLRIVSTPGRSNQIIKSSKPWILFVCMFLIYGQMIGISSWITNYMLAEIGAQPSLASLALPFYWIGIISGRFITAKQLIYQHPLKLIFRGGLASGVLLLIGIVIKIPLITFIAVGFAGFFAGGVVPLLTTVGCRRFPANSGTILSISFLGGSVAVFAFPLLIEVISEVASFSVGMSVTVAVSILLALLIRWAPAFKKGSWQ
jgi:fucose permease